MERKRPEESNELLEMAVLASGSEVAGRGSGAVFLTGMGGEDCGSLGEAEPPGLSDWRVLAVREREKGAENAFQVPGSGKYEMVGFGGEGLARTMRDIVWELVERRLWKAKVGVHSDSGQFCGTGGKVPERMSYPGITWLSPWV